ncbi:MAG: dihydropteroate synthase [Thermoguttaceae bacterium]
MSQTRDKLIQSGIAPKAIVIDPGIGFGKTTAHNMEILSELDLLHKIAHNRSAATDPNFPEFFGFDRN